MSSRDKVETLLAVFAVGLMLWVAFTVIPYNPPQTRRTVVAEIALMSDGTVRVGEQLYVYENQTWIEK